MYSGEAVEKAELAAQLLGILVVAPVPAESRDYFGSKILASARHTWSGVRKFPILVWAVTNSDGCSKQVLSNLDWLGEFSKIPTWPDPCLGHPGLVPSGDWVHLEKDLACISILCLFFPPSNTDIKMIEDVKRGLHVSRHSRGIRLSLLAAQFGSRPSTAWLCAMASRRIESGQMIVTSHSDWSLESWNQDWGESSP